jgi:hypothetical protein
MYIVLLMARKMSTAVTPSAFMSYAHIDNQYAQLSEFRERLTNEVHVQTGEPFPIFQDRNDIQFGQPWRERIESAIGSEVTFLIPIITPSFFKSQACREELQMFLDREKKLGRTDLVLPVYFVSARVVDDEVARATDPLASAVATRQWADWRGLRFEPFASPQVGRALMQLAAQITLAVERVRVSAAPVAHPRSQKRPAKRRSRESAGRRTDQTVAELRRVLVLYALHDAPMVRQLETRLARLFQSDVIESWRSATLGADGDLVDDNSLRGRIVLVLVSPDLLASDWVYSEAMNRLMAKHEANEIVLVPTILRPCDWGGTPFAKLQALPADATPISSWANRDDAFDDVAEGISRIAKR